ncbi:lycopene cyclase family protein [Pedobacter foliorum]|uniref:lycopene cyclase family protein n=1 Tax=Pedobacter foliorum TaxID=2739058 RepID=UPI001567555E|nr:lycopene cyclase family protein [Pedobacter foliorum]NRF37641.1 lycopene cyclase [Pedobacter foliorum]
MGHFDYIIAGGGCSGRSLAVRMLPYLRAFNKRALLVDKELKKGNDKTWCFWEKHPDTFEPIVYRKWDRLSFSSSFIDQELDIQPYQYKMIRSEDFYCYTDDQLDKDDHIQCINGNVEELYTKKELAHVRIDGALYTADYIFSSIPQAFKKRPDRYQYLLQHFQGWVIETEGQTFNPDCATLMDFNTPQQVGTSFVYVLPLGSNRALVEYTVFSEKELPAEYYSAALEQYITEQLHCKKYSIKAQEYGVIPMSDHPIRKQRGRIIYLGTAGGFTKGSTGYTFSFIQRHTAAIVEKLIRQGDPRIPPVTAQRFNTYDGILLHLLSRGRLSGEKIFSKMFEENSPVQVLKFLDNDTSILEELQLFSTLQKKEFALAFLRRTFKLMGIN